MRNTGYRRNLCGISAESLRDAGSMRDFGGILVQDAGCGIFAESLRNAGFLRDAGCGIYAECGILAGCGIHAEFMRDAKFMRDILRLRNLVYAGLSRDAGFTRIRYWDKRVGLMRLHLDSSALASVNSAVRSERTVAASGIRSRSIPRHGRTYCYNFVIHSLTIIEAFIN